MVLPSALPSVLGDLSTLVVVLLVVVALLGLSQAAMIVLVMRRNRSFNKLVEATNLLIDDIDQARFERLLSPPSMQELEHQLFDLSDPDEAADAVVRPDALDAVGSDEESGITAQSLALAGHAARAHDDSLEPVALPESRAETPVAAAPAVELADAPVVVIAESKPNEDTASRRTTRTPPPLASKAPARVADVVDELGFDPDAEYGGTTGSRAPQTSPERIAEQKAAIQHAHENAEQLMLLAQQQHLPAAAPTLDQYPVAHVVEPWPNGVPQLPQTPQYATADPMQPPYLATEPPASAPAATPAQYLNSPLQNRNAPPPQVTGTHWSASSTAAPQPASQAPGPVTPVVGGPGAGTMPAVPPRMPPRQPASATTSSSAAPASRPAGMPVRADGFASVEEMAVSAVIDGGRPVPQVAQTLRVSTALVAYWVSKSGRSRIR